MFAACVRRLSTHVVITITCDGSRHLKTTNKLLPESSIANTLFPPDVFVKPSAIG